MRSFYIALILIFSTAYAQAELPSYEDFKANIKLGSFKCDLDKFLEKAGLSDHEAFQKKLSKAEMKERFYDFFTDTIYEGIVKSHSLNPELAEMVAENSMKFSARYRCDYTSLKGRYGAYVNKRFMFFGKKSMNIGLATLVIFAEHPEHGLNNEDSAVWAKRYIYHEHLHTHLHPDKNKFVRHTRNSAKISFRDDIVYALSNHAFRVPILDDFRKPHPIPIYPSLLKEPKAHVVQRAKKIKKIEKKNEKKKISPHVYTVSHCNTAYFAELGGKGVRKKNVDMFSADFDINDYYTKCGDVDHFDSFMLPL